MAEPEITWREVTSSQYYQSKFDAEPHRYVGPFGGKPEKFELGTVPVPLPTKPGAIVAYKGVDTFNPYVLSNDGYWYELNTWNHPTDEAAAYILALLNKPDSEWYVAFEGLEIK
jgi:hypothetical protein